MKVNELSALEAYASLFAAALLAATLVPAQSELLLGALHLTGRYSAGGLFAAALAGNVLGSLTNWALGRYLMRFADRRWFPVGPALVARATAWFQRFGVWSLLLAWVPFVGDPLTLVAGIMRINLWLFLALVTLGKAARYAVVMTVS